MCGIAGLRGTRDPARTRRMLERLQHRGPDGLGVEVINEVAVGNVRLAIVDVPRGRQPIVSADGARAIAHNGEIYNFRALRDELEGPFGTDTDTEVLLRLYARDGPAMVERLDGMFAFAITDGDDLFMARDPLGIKPLYYGERDGAFVFASEIKALMDEVDDLCEFPPGHCYHSRSGFHQYFALRDPDGAEFSTQARACASLRLALEQAVRKRLMADVPVGVCLSGGLDSSLIAALAARHHDGPLHTFAVGTPDAPDLRRARRVARHLGSVHHERLYGLEEMLRVLPEVIYYLESYDVALVRSAIPNYFVAELAQPFVKVILGGEGADELFSGYSYLKQLPDDELGEELLQITEALHNTNLQRTDRMTMAHGLEGRVPFLDVQMLRVAFRIPDALKLYGAEQTEKWVLRQAFQDLLPGDIIWRKKQKFSQGAGSADLLADYAEAQMDDAELARAQDEHPDAALRGKEELLYFRLFREQFPTLDPAAIGRSRSV